MWGEKRRLREAHIKTKQAFPVCCGVVPRHLDALLAGPGQNLAVDPDARIDLKPDNTLRILASGKQRQKDPWGLTAA